MSAEVAVPEAARVADTDGTITVVVLGFNAYPFLKTAIESCLSEPLVERCVVVIDGGSSPESVAMAREVRQQHRSRVDVLELKVNVGPSSARNLGLEQVKTRWVALLDGDDVIEPGGLAQLREALRSTRDAAMAWGHYELIDQSGGPAAGVFRSDEQGQHAIVRGSRTVRVALNVESVLTQFQVSPPSCWLLDVEVARRLGGFDPELRQSKREDVEFVARVLANGYKIVEVDANVARRRVHPGQQSGQRSRIDLKMIPSRWVTLRRSRWVDRPEAARGLHGLFAMKHLRARADGDYLRSSFWLASRAGSRALSSSELALRVVAGRKRLPTPVVGAPKSPPVR